MAAEQGNSGANTGSSSAEKVRVTGRIGQAPQYRTVPDQQHPGEELLIGNFSIAEHPDSSNRDATVWHEVATFGDRTRRLQKAFDEGELHVGQEVEVVGTLHRRTRPTKDGGSKEVEQIYAFAVKPVVKDSKDASAGQGDSNSNSNRDSVGPSELQPPSWEPKS